MKIFVIDNYDSFTYNLVHMLNNLGAQVVIKRNDQLDIEEIAQYDKIVISPGPGIPSEAGQTTKIILKYASQKPILGVCLGHQAIGECFGGQLVNLQTVYHGVSTKISVKEDYLFKDCDVDITVGRYHSWALASTLPQSLECLAVDKNNIVMAIKHKEYDVRGVQFHPESILTPMGKTIIKNWVEH